MTGLYQRSGIWHIDKVVKGERLQESTGTSEREEAEQYLIHRLEQLRQQRVYGLRRTRIWREAATRYLVEFADQPSAWLTATYLEQLDPYIGDLPLTHIDDDSLEPYVQHRRNAGISHRTINIALERVIRILNVCARKWRDEERRPWLDTVPMITKLDEKKTKRQPYPMSWEEQSLLFAELPDHLHRMALYKVNTGSREQEVCKLRWDWEIKVPQLDSSVFLIPAQFGGRQEGSGVKNGEERLIVLNRVAKSVIDRQRGLHPEYVFPYGKPAGPMHRMNDSAWRKARKRAAAKWEEIHGSPAHPGFTSFRVHDLKHTFGRRLRAADVTKEDRQVLLGHTNGSVTSDYSAAELGHLIEVANKVAATDSRGPVLTILKRRYG
ncbi:tyrosine-type recombinase/integrase [Halopseudomonas aestusnigri]|uniref:tyrosine-type recombinase/integrase n=1 Tax=Halopseudomonas aestusnigri TaxID=857252 RepID=UPI0030023FF2